MSLKSVCHEKTKSCSDKKVPLFSIRVRERRLSLGLIQAELGDRCGFMQKEISAIESGRFMNDSDRVIALARALETTPDYLFGFRDEP